MQHARQGETTLPCRTCVGVAGAGQRHAVLLPAAQVDALLSNLGLVACKRHVHGKPVEGEQMGKQVGLWYAELENN